MPDRCMRRAHAAMIRLAHQEGKGLMPPTATQAPPTPVSQRVVGVHDPLARGATKRRGPRRPASEGECSRSRCGMGTMIISASYKTDIPAFYGEWFMRRLQAGWCQTHNPYGRQVYTINLRREPDDAGREGVDGIVFWTKNIAPFMRHLAVVAECGYPFVVQHSITGYPRVLEQRVVDWERAAACMREIART